MILDDKLAAGDVIVLDGAIGSEIDRIGGKMDEAAWCGLANLTDPGTVRRVHESYLEAGADRDHRQHVRELPTCAGGRWLR